MKPTLDIVIPVYNEGKNISATLESFLREVKTPFEVLICYDRDGDNTLPALEPFKSRMSIRLVKNQGKGALGAVLSGLQASTSPAVIVLPADDDYNAGRLDVMVEKFKAGNEIVAACRFMPGGSMVGCSFLKAFLVRTSAFVLYHVACVPTRDASNGFRLFSQKVLRTIPIESRVGFAYSIELLVKCQRLGWPIAEVAVHWFERKHGASRFQVVKWLPQYLKWFRFAFATTYLGKGPRTVEVLSAREATSEIGEKTWQKSR